MGAAVHARLLLCVAVIAALAQPGLLQDSKPATVTSKVVTFAPEANGSADIDPTGKHRMKTINLPLQFR